MTRYRCPPVILTPLAPAAGCNQRCPLCALDQVGEQVRRFHLTPRDYAAFVEQFAAEDVPVLSVVFQGYEVTLPRSFPFVEATFRTAKAHGMWCGFVTNGMLLAKRASQIAALDVDGITVSLDGPSAEVNDPIRGLVGAFERTVSALAGFLDRAPGFEERVEVASTVYDHEQGRALLAMPRLLRSLGVRSWSLGRGLRLGEGAANDAHDLTPFRALYAELLAAADAEGLRAYVSDEFGFFGAEDRERLRVRRVFNPNFLYRLDPLGYVRSGSHVLERWDPSTAMHWDPRADNAVEAVGYWETAAPFLNRASSA